MGFPTLWKSSVIAERSGCDVGRLRNGLKLFLMGKTSENRWILENQNEMGISKPGRSDWIRLVSPNTVVYSLYAMCAQK